jgi:hypothetical protein
MQSRQLGMLSHAADQNHTMLQHQLVSQYTSYALFVQAGSADLNLQALQHVSVVSTPGPGTHDAAERPAARLAAQVLVRRQPRLSSGRSGEKGYYKGGWAPAGTSPLATPMA